MGGGGSGDGETRRSRGENTSEKLQGSKLPALIHGDGWEAGWSEGRGRCAAAQVRGGLGGLRGAGSYLPDLVITISVPSL